jgi:hypothetical protein
VEINDLKKKNVNRIISNIHDDFEKEIKSEFHGLGKRKLKKI